MNDYLVRGMTMDGFVKAVAIRSTELVRRGAQIQGTTPNATAAFGRCLTMPVDAFVELVSNEIKDQLS